MLKTLSTDDRAAALDKAVKDGQITTRQAQRAAMRASGQVYRREAHRPEFGSIDDYDIANGR